MNSIVRSEIQELIELTSKFSKRPDQIQGPGGNTSVKTDDGKMFIKASGFRFEELNETSGISAVNSATIADYFRHVKPVDKAAEEKRMLEIIAENTLLKPDGTSYPKPSMETGFHAVLGNYVVHTHSVWSNLFNCAENSTELITKLRDTSGLSIAEIPFVSPGFGLSYLVTETLKFAEENSLTAPEVFMLANHGIIAHASTAERVIELLDIMDTAIRTLLGIEAAYPSCSVSKNDGEVWTPQDGFIPEMLQQYACTADFFNHVLFPDQTVFFSGQISDTREVLKKINLTGHSVFYACGEREASSINETLCAYLFLHHNFKQLNLKARYVTQSDIDYINTMDMEKYRKRGMENRRIDDEGIGR